MTINVAFSPESCDVGQLLTRENSCNRPRLHSSLHSNLALRGGGYDLPFDASQALQLNMVVYLIFGLLGHPDVNLPLFDMTLKKHDTRASLFYNDPTPESESFVKVNRWIGTTFITVAVSCSSHFAFVIPQQLQSPTGVDEIASLQGLCHALSSADEGTKKKANQVLTLSSGLAMLNM